MDSGNIGVDVNAVEKESEMPPMNKSGRILYIKVVLEYQGKMYEIKDDHSDFKFQGHDEVNTFMWEEGNYSCDCNKSLFIQRQCDPEFKEMDCGDEIKLISQEFIGEWK